MVDLPTATGIGQPVRRREDLRFITGKGCYIDDLSLPGQAYAAMVRSHHAHAIIRSIDTVAARGTPGVLAVLTGKDWLADGLKAPETRTEATEALRGLIDAITLTPEAGILRIELKGNLAAMLGATVQSKRSPETGDLSLQVSMVAGACNQLNLEFSWTAA